MTDNKQLEDNIRRELDWDTRFDASNVAITVDGCSVTLSGHVHSFPEIFRVREAVLRVRGVRTVADDMYLHLPAHDERSDSDIAKGIAYTLEHNVNLAQTDIKAEVSDGVVNLSGLADWQHQREEARSQVANVRGVKEVVNNIELRERLTPENVKEQIEAALARNAELEAQHIDISIDDGKVTLSGRVKAFYERNLVEAAAWRAPGVHKVVDKIEVG